MVLEEIVILLEISTNTPMFAVDEPLVLTVFAVILVLSELAFTTIPELFKVPLVEI